MSEVFAAPPRRGDISHIADFVEVQCLARDDLNVAVNDISYAMSDLLSDDVPSSLEEESREEDAPEVWEALDDVDMRKKHCGARAFYPFRRGPRGNEGQVAIARPKNDGQRWHALLYLFLLWLTRIGKHDAQAQAGRGLFERLCCDVASNYWGCIAGEKAPFIHFGAHGSFRAKIEDLAKKLCEEGGIREKTLNSGRRPKDDGVDIVVYRPFADRRVGQLIGLGQCKSGHGYGRKELTELQPDDFFRIWFQYPVSKPTSQSVRLFFLSDRIANDEEMREKCNRGGIVFDRCRVMEYAGEVDHELKRKIAAWILARLEESEVLDRLEAAGMKLRTVVE